MILITFEGTDGSGKSSASRRILKRLQEAGYDAALSREPTHERYGTEMRRLAGEGLLTPEKELELFLLDRQDHVATLTHEIELVDRYYHSTMAYQGARGMDMGDLERVNVMEHKFPVPDLTMFFDCDVELGLSRSEKTGEAIEKHFEKQEFLEKVRANYRNIYFDSVEMTTIPRFTENIKLIDAGKKMDDMMDDVYSVLGSFLLDQATELDEKGTDQKTVLELYQKVLKFDDDSTIAWRHYLCFLIVIANDELFKEEWKRVRDSIGWEDIYYEHLYVPVVAQLLKRARLTEAREIVNKMDDEKDHWKRQLDSRLSGFEHVKSHNFCVFPTYVPFEKWWHGPHLIDLKWYPGKVTAIDRERCDLICEIAKLDKMVYDELNVEAEPLYGHLDISFRKWNSYCDKTKAVDVEVGTFFELYKFGMDQGHIEVHNTPEDWPPAWVEPKMAGDRYLRNLGWENKAEADDRFLSAMKKALEAIKEDRSLVHGCPSTRGDDVICVQNLEDWAGNHLFDDHHDDFGLTELEGHTIRSYFQTTGGFVNSHDHKAGHKLMDGQFGEFLEDEEQNL